MHVVYFPLTYLSGKAGRKLTACFSNIVVYQAVKASVESKGFPGLETFAPVAGDEANLQKAIKSYKVWAALHQGEALADFKPRMDEVPFYSDNSIAGIKSDIQKRSSSVNDSESEEKASPEQALFAARLFLSMAHEHDAGEDQIQNDLLSMKTLEQELFRELKGETEDLDEDLKFAEAIQSPAPEEPAEDYLMDRRISAWARLALADSKRAFVYVATSRAALEFLVETGMLKAEPLFQIKNIPLSGNEQPNRVEWKQGLMKVLEECALGREPSGNPAPPASAGVRAEEAASLSVYIAPNTDPQLFLNRLIGKKELSSRDSGKDPSYPHTLVCLVE